MGVELVAGDGDDRLEGGEIADGGPGNDTLVGAGFARGGDGDDMIADAGGADGGAGADRVTASDRTSYDRFVGGPGDDTLTGRSGNDTLEPTLVGDDAANHLGGGPGQDRLSGIGGDDLLEGGAGFDVFDAGAGDDRIDAASSYELGLPSGLEIGDAGPEPIGCGPGRDTIIGIAGDLVAADCERLPFGLRPRPIATGARTVDVVIPCRRAVQVVGRRCRGTVRAANGPPRQSGRREVVRGRFDFRAGRSRRVRLRGADVGGTEPLAITVRYIRGDDVTVRWMIPRER